MDAAGDGAGDDVGRDHAELAEADQRFDPLFASSGGKQHVAVERQVHADVGTGPAQAVQADRGSRLALAPYLALVAFLPLGLLLWRRDR